MKKVRFEIGRGDSKIVLSYWCEKCQGKDFTCEPCGGTGQDITVDGKMLLAFVNKIALKLDIQEKP